MEWENSEDYKNAMAEAQEIEYDEHESVLPMTAYDVRAQAARKRMMAESATIASKNNDYSAFNQQVWRGQANGLTRDADMLDAYAVLLDRTPDMVCEQHPELEWPHGDCPGPGCPGHAQVHLLVNQRRLAEQHVREQEEIVRPLMAAHEASLEQVCETCSRAGDLFYGSRECLLAGRRFDHSLQQWISVNMVPITSNGRPFGCRGHQLKESA